MRLFVAVDLSDTAIEEARRAIARLQRRIGRDEPIRWVPLSNLHLTVRFIGEVAEAQAQAVIDRVSAPLSTQPFRMAFDRCGVFPRHGPPRVIWIGVGAGAPALQALHDELDARLEPLGYPGEARTFAPHLTLARVPSPRHGAAVRKAVEGARTDKAGTDVEHAVLYRSYLSPRGARYEPVRRIPLAGGTRVD